MDAEECQNSSKGCQFDNPLNKYTNFTEVTPSKPDISLYRAICTITNKTVFIKIFSHSILAEILYRRERDILKKLSHPNIIQLLETVDSCTSIFNGSTVSFLAVEYAEFSDLFTIVAKCGAMSRDLTRTLFKRLLAAVEELHQNKIAHMDLKLENLLIMDTYELKICDFDLSLEIGNSGHSSVASGTPNWRAPELKNGLCNDFNAADIFSLGVILFVMQSGTPPYMEIECCGFYKFDGRYSVLQTNPNRFWDGYSKIMGASDFYEDEFKSLVNSMLHERPEMRPTIQGILESPYMQGKILSNEEYTFTMKNYLEKEQMS